MDFCITIRTMIKKQNKVYLQAGVRDHGRFRTTKGIRGVL
ncbi:MAG: hypothetical protein V8T65_07120 [Roseburia inulinivorans]